MWIRIAALLLFALTTMSAGEQLQPPNLKNLPKADFQKLFSGALPVEKTPDLTKALDLLAAATNKPCSIPLTELKVEHPEQFAIKRLPVQSGDRIATPPPTPACKNW